ncbi:MAG TPA: hypothetical protein VJQ59_05755 [Candidatus Sulfotelmatobacter sp.]|nr:hypothetical protein [Candidatus Sulfotelmatobacter sp.]
MSGVKEFSGFTTGDAERLGKSQNPHPVAENATRVGQPQFESFDSEETQWEELLAEALRILRDDGEEDPGEEWCPEYEQGERLAKVDEEARQRRIYRGRTVAMLRRYMKYSIETGRLPSILGREFFRAKVTSYTVVTFEDRVIFVHDMERCLDRLDEFSRQLIARHILQEHDRWETARLLQCNEKTVRRLTPMALDVLCEILLDVGLMDRLKTDRRKSCQGGFQSQKFVSDCEDAKNKF